MHFQVKNTLKNNRNHTTNKHFIHVFLLHIRLNHNFYQTYLNTTNHIFLKLFFFNHSHKYYLKNKYTLKMTNFIWAKSNWCQGKVAMVLDFCKTGM